MTDMTWLVVLPQTPATPSRLRISVWRRLQQAGTLHLQTGAWMLPQTPEQVHILEALLTDMEQQGGSGFFQEGLPTLTSEETSLSMVDQEDEKGHETRER